jgi:Nitroreductase family
MPVIRRNFILGAGGTLAAICAGGTWRVTRMPARGIVPWSLDPAPPADVRLDAFRHAILAPNPHNRQPWLIKLLGRDEAIISCDLDKRLPETDPFDRQITIGFGTFLELARIAAAERGVRMDIQPFPFGEPSLRLDARPVARLRFSPDTAALRDPLFATIIKRRTNRLVYHGAPTEPQLAALRSEGAELSVDRAFLAKLSAITVAAITDETTTHRTHMESVRLLRIGHQEVDASPDGLFLTGPMIEATSMLGMTTRESIANPSSSAFKIGLDGLRETYGSVPAVAWIVTPSNTRADQIAAGMSYARLSLRASSLGLAMHPMSQSLQEYPEMADHFDRVHTLLGVARGERLQMLARVGKAPDVPPAARWPLQKHIVA